MLSGNLLPADWETALGEVTTPNCFPDVGLTHPNMIAICALKGQDIIQGYPDGTFRPIKSLNRAELLKILIENKGVSPALAEYSDCFPDAELCRQFFVARLLGFVANRIFLVGV